MKCITLTKSLEIDSTGFTCASQGRMQNTSLHIIWLQISI